MSLYKSISSFGSNTYSPVNNPLTYCINDNMDQRFLHGGNSTVFGQYSAPCQLFLSEYCADEWDEFCELASKNSNTYFPGNPFNGSDYGGLMGLTAGEQLIRNTAQRKYLTRMLGATIKKVPFDPLVATSPMVSYWVQPNGSVGGVPEYSVNPKDIDKDIVMNKILDKPTIAMDILMNIYNTMKRQGTLDKLNGTRLGNYYSNQPYFKQVGGIGKR